MLQQQQRIGNAIGLALLDQPALQLEAVRVRHEPEPPDLQGFHKAFTETRNH